MRTLAEAKRLINSSNDPSSIDELLVHLGFNGAARALDDVARERLGLPTSVMTARIARGDGVLRALAVELATDADVPHTLAIIAQQLSTRVPHLLWLIVAVQIERPLFAVAVWRASTARPQLLTLSSVRGGVIDSDAETLCALAACVRGPAGDVMRHLRWLDVLGREAITRRFYRALEQSVGQLAQSLEPTVPSDAAREIALLTTSRLLFLSFLETKGWLNADFGFLANSFADCMAAGGRYHRRVLEPLFFGTLNTRVSARAARARSFGRVPFLNGGLFARSAIEKRWRGSSLSDSALGAFFGDLLVRYRFTPQEEASSWSEAAIDPEILGKAFESLMNVNERKRGGVFYTPQTFVERLTKLTLIPALRCARVSRDIVEQALGGNRPDDEISRILLERVARMRILDPACGSGAFLVHALERISLLRITLGDARPVATIRRAVLTQSIYGVDTNPTAVWLCELRLWLATVIESNERDPMRILPLPNLDRQIRIGDSLAAPAFGPVTSAVLAQPVTRLRQRYSRATGQRKATLARELDRAERQRAIAQLDRSLTQASTERRELVWSARATDLFDARAAPNRQATRRVETLRRTVRTLRARRLELERGGALPFSFPAHFAEAADAGGFDAVIGNPPWIRIHNIPVAARDSYRHTFETFRHAAWASGANAAGAGTGFGGQTDAAALFLERACDLTKTEGTVGLLLPAKLWRSLAGGGIRNFVTEHMQLSALEDYTEAPASFDAAVYPSMLVATKRGACNADTWCDTVLIAGVQKDTTVVRWPVTITALNLDASNGSPWLIIPPAVRTAFDRVSTSGTPMARAAPGRPWLGVKTGCNAAYVVRELSASTDLTLVSNGERSGEIESSLLRPLVRGEALTAWSLAAGEERIIWTHDDLAHPLGELPPHAMRWLKEWRRTLERRSDARRACQWWSLFRTESAAPDRSRVVWNDFGRIPRAAVLLPGDVTVPLNTCYVARCDAVSDAYTLTALLNSPLLAAWLSVLAEPARGGYHRYLGWTMAMLPMPRDWTRARDILCPLAERAINGGAPSRYELHQATLAAYRLRPDSVAPLMEWANRP